MIKNKEIFKYLLPLWLITLVAIMITFAHHSGLIIDCGREAYYPQEILAGKVLFKDLFNIYGPFSYLFNTVLYKIFGISLTTLYVAGSICALGIVTLVFFIAKRFLSASFALYIGIFTIAIGILSTDIFNYIFPYSFGMTYGLLGFLISLFALINYIDFKLDKYLYLSLFFAGFAVSNKYEFLPYLLIYLPIFYKNKFNLSKLVLCFLFFSIIPEISFAYLFAKGLNVQDILNTLNIINVMVHTKTLKYFYIHSGIFFHKESILAISFTLLVLLIPFIIYFLPVLLKNKIKNSGINLIFTYTGFCLLFLFKIGNSFDAFISLPFLLCFLIILNYKKLLKNFPLFILTTSVFLVSLKVFWGTLLNSYGVYYLPIILICIFAILKDKFSDKEIDYAGFYILILSVLIGFNNLQIGSLKSNLISTKKGNIFVEKKYNKTTVELLDFINKNTKKSDKILILPEGMMLNYLSERKTDDFYNSLLPLYEETFSDEVIISHFKKSMPDYVIFNNWNSSDYYFSWICKDYAIDFCNFVKENYFEKTRLTGDFNYVIFQKK